MRRGRQGNPSESSEQRAVIDWWTLFSRSRFVDERLLFSLPNGAHLAGNERGRAIQVQRLKAEGLRPGAPDLMLAVPLMNTTNNVVFHGLFIEMKSKIGRVRPEQAEFHGLLRMRGYNVVVCWGFDDAVRAITAYLDAGKRKPH